MIGLAGSESWSPSSAVGFRPPDLPTQDHVTSLEAHASEPTAQRLGLGGSDRLDVPLAASDSTHECRLNRPPRQPNYVQEMEGTSGHDSVRGEHTWVRHAVDADLDLLAGWFADPDVYRWWGGEPIDSSSVRDDYTGHRSPAVECFIVEADGSPIGFLQYWRAAERSGGVDMFLVPEARGRGLGPDAARATAEFLLHECGWTEVTVDPLTDNERAIRAFARAGFIAERESRDEETGKPCLIMVMRRPELST
jgi:aminoglycoside 6'-N-acetyltransferase